jgi:hypothetical protein
MFKNRSLQVLLLSTTLVFSIPVSAIQASAHDDYVQAYEIGIMVQQLQLALTASEDVNSLTTIQHYGTDSRYYSMIRGWLMQELLGSQSQLNASNDPLYIDKFQQQTDFLKQAIRMIDLE